MNRAQARSEGLQMEETRRRANVAAYEQKLARRERLFEPGTVPEREKEETVEQREVLKLSRARELTPRPTGIGAWAEKLREAAFDAVRESDIKELMEALLKRAKEGDLAAAKLVLAYLTGGGAPRVQKVTIIDQRPAGGEKGGADGDGD